METQISEYLAILQRRFHQKHQVVQLQYYIIYFFKENRRFLKGKNKNYNRCFTRVFGSKKMYDTPLISENDFGMNKKDCN